MERVMGIEPTLRAWEAPVLPLNYTRLGGRSRDAHRVTGSFGPRCRIDKRFAVVGEDAVPALELDFRWSHILGSMPGGRMPAG